MLGNSLYYIHSISRSVLFEHLWSKRTFLNAANLAIELSSTLHASTSSVRMSSSTSESKSREAAPVIANRTASSASCSAKSINSGTNCSTTALADGDLSTSTRSLADDSREHLKRKDFSGRKTKKGKKLDKHPKKIPKFSNDEKFNETTYYYENGLRKVRPYVYVFETHIKGRWMGRTVLDVFRGEFRMESPEYYKMAIRNGLITINRQKVSADKILRNNEFLRSMVHRHEPPVTGEPLDIITNNEEFVVINKPASIPVHPCGKYRHNTIIFMLGKDHGLTGLHTIHRLDRLTSGLLMFARTREVSQRVDAYVRDRKLTKVYMCKVDGKFPSEPVDCSQPIYTVSHKIGVCRVSPDGKPCQTAFKRLSYDGHTSIVQCTPHTGRMHQIRVHLQYLGYPIVNDPLYNNPVWGPQLGKGGDIPHTDENELLSALIKQHTAELKSQVIEDPDEFVKITRHQPDECHGTGTADGAATEGTGSKDGSAAHREDAETTSDTNMTIQDDKASAEQNMEATAAASNQENRADPSQTQQCVRNEDAFKLQDQSESEDRGCSLKSADEPGKDEVGEPKLIPQAGPSSRPDVLPLSPGSERGVERPPESDEKDSTEEELHALVLSHCRECKLKLRDPKPEEMTMYLHALSYKGPDFEFSTPLPRWAEEHMQRSLAMEAATTS